MRTDLLLAFAAVLLNGSTVADHNATKADYNAGKLTPSDPLPKGSGCSCQDALVGIRPPSPFNFNGDTTGSLNTVDTLPLACNGNHTVAPGPDDIFSFTAAVICTFEVSTNDANYDPSIYLLSTCGDGSTCPAGLGSDSCWAVNAVGNPCGANSTESFSTQGAPAGAHFFYVDSFYAPNVPNGRDSGPYTLLVGCIPVELLHFTVE